MDDWLDGWWMDIFWVNEYRPQMGRGKKNWHTPFLQLQISLTFYSPHASNVGGADSASQMWDKDDIGVGQCENDPMCNIYANVFQRCPLFMEACMTVPSIWKVLSCRVSWIILQAGPITFSNAGCFSDLLLAKCIWKCSKFTQQQKYHVYWRGPDFKSCDFK